MVLLIGKLFGFMIWFWGSSRVVLWVNLFRVCLIVSILISSILVLINFRVLCLFSVVLFGLIDISLFGLYGCVWVLVMLVFNIFCIGIDCNLVIMWGILIMICNRKFVMKI